MCRREPSTTIASRCTPAADGFPSIESGWHAPRKSPPPMTAIRPLLCGALASLACAALVVACGSTAPDGLSGAADGGGSDDSSAADDGSPGTCAQGERICSACRG